MRSLLVVVAALAACAGLAAAVGTSTRDVLGVSAPIAVVAVVFVLNAVAFVPAALRRTERFYDAVGALSHLSALAVAVVAAGGTGRAWALAAPVLVWAVRLGLFLGVRGVREGDARFEAIKQDVGRFAVAWALQAAWVCVTTIAVVGSVAASEPPSSMGAWEAAGLTLWAGGFALEWAADAYKTRFRRARPGEFVHGGPWDLSRHPNYLGEIVLWAGLFVAGVPSYRGGAWLVVVSPIFVWTLLRFGSGVPLLEARADARWGGRPDYEAYKRRVPILWPLPRGR
jgi:steroid 5-alpha reductase family enzyme